LDIAILATLALLDPNRHALAVDVRGAQMNRLADAHAGSVHGAEDDMVMERGSGF
jgi:hypothetical protein